MNKLAVTKKVTALVCGHSVGFTVARIAAANAPTNGGLYQKSCVVIGAFTLGTIASMKTEKYTDEFIDQLADSFSEIKNSTN